MEPTSCKSWADLEETVGTRFDDLALGQNVRRLVAIIVGSDGSKLMQDTIVKRINELHFRSGDAIDFYVLGWTWKSSTQNFPKGGPDPSTTKVEVEFLPQKFSQSIDALHQRLNWRYSGEVDLILMDAVQDSKGVMLDDRYAIAVNLTQRSADGTIMSINTLIESIIEFSKSSVAQYPIQEYARQRLISVGLSGITEAVTSFSPKGIQRLVKNAIYMIPMDRASKEGRMMRLARQTVKKGLSV